MIERKKVEDFELKIDSFLNKFCKIILSNQMHYTGKVLSVGNDYVKIKDKYGAEVFIVIEQICSIQEEL